ncbi:hypothetical protein ACFHWW_03400 [Ensifer sp. P24N7]|uniref:hypothetical protein n=1 Tax=Sinorhizobium sp. P24N7 TaxID=3348358 RepID=UPI0035F363C1
MHRLHAGCLFFDQRQITYCAMQLCECCAAYKPGADRRSLHPDSVIEKHGQTALAGSLRRTRIVEIQHIVTVDALLLASDQTLSDALQIFATPFDPALRQDLD